MRRHHLVIIAVVALALIGIALYAMRAQGVHETAARPDALAKLVAVDRPRRLPAAAFFDAKGERMSLASFNGHYVLLNLWATWCGPCVRELPALAKLQQAVPSLSIVAVSEGRENAADTERFLKSHGAGSLHVYTDPDHAFLAALGVVGLPLSVLMDEKGLEQARAEGPAEWDNPEAITYMRALAAGKNG
ncbi:MAG TPA: TlpA disulfide reductase family protein [Rhizomicrobium sp.]|nr:TlpA disulfide reductase family protein [Rhizomicrobium sp.]